MNQQEQMYTLVGSWRESGLAKSKFCKEAQISLHRFNYWLKKFNKDNNRERSKPEVSFFSASENPKKDKKQLAPKLTDRKTMRIELPGGITITIY
jgi:hypothetical protein